MILCNYRGIGAAGGAASGRGRGSALQLAGPGPLLSEGPEGPEGPPVRRSAGPEGPPRGLQLIASAGPPVRRSAAAGAPPVRAGPAVYMFAG